MIVSKKFLELNPYPVSEIEEVPPRNFLKELEGIKTIFDFYEKYSIDDDFLKGIFSHGKILWVKRLGNTLARFRVTDSIPHNGAWLMMNHSTPLEITRIGGFEARDIADLLVDSGVAVYKRHREKVAFQVRNCAKKIQRFKKMFVRF